MRAWKTSKEKSSAAADLAKIAGVENVLCDEPMSRHTTFRIGGPADILAAPCSEESASQVLRYLREREIPCYVIGNGSNLLVRDGGIAGVVVQFGRPFGAVAVNGTQIYAQAGAMLSGIAKTALRSSLTGLEFASGIPGTLGGACVMNAGAYGGELKDVAESVRVLTSGGEVLELSSDRMQFGYRTSVVCAEGYIVLGAKLCLEEGDPEAIAARMEELKEMRTSKQPLDLPSAGSTFKRPEGHFAGKLIMDAGLKGLRVGGAMVSPRHCGFVVNAGGATAADVLSLMAQVQEHVYEQFGVRLEPEVKVLGEA